MLDLTWGVRLADGADVGSSRVRLSLNELAALGCAFGDPVVVSIYHEDSEWHFLCLAASQAGDARPAVLDVTVQLPPLAASPDHVRQRLEAGLPCRATARKLPGRPLVCESLVVSSRAPGAAEALLQNRVVLSQCVVHLGHTQAHVLRARAASGATPDAPLRVLPSTLISRGDDDGDAPAAEVSIRAVEAAGEPLPVVGGSPAALAALEELISWPMLHADAAAALGVRWPRGVLLHGPPGCGKSLLVAAAAARCGAVLHRLSAGDVVGAWAGESERNLRAAFVAAQAAVAGGQPCVLFLDEVDALCPRRGAGGAHEDRLTAQLLVLMDGAVTGLAERGGKRGARLLLVGATNRPEALDPALRRPGRFDVELEVEVPGPGARADILAAHTARLALAPDVDLAALAARCHGYSGADLAALAREAAMVAIEEEAAGGEAETGGGMPQVHACHFTAARSRVGASLVRGTSVEAPRVAWGDIGGLEQVKQRLRQAVEWPLTHSASFARLGVKPPKGVLLHGPPGCSKTQLARAAAAASGANLIPLTGSQLFSMYLGAGERLLAAAFARARAAAPAIIFLDEVDSVAGARGEGGAGGGGGGSGAEERLLSTLLTELDGILPSAGVMLLCATNRAHVLDPALLRPGRLDVHLYVPPPDAAGRAAVLRIHTRAMALAPDVDLAAMAAASDGYTGAELAGVCVEAAQVAVRARGRDVEAVEQAHFLAALAAMPPSLTPQMLAEYSAFDARRRGRPE